MAYYSKYQSLSTVPAEVLNEIGQAIGTGVTVTPNERDTLTAMHTAVINLGLQSPFLDQLVKRIGLVRFNEITATNPLEKFRKGTLENGATVEQIHVNIAKGYARQTDYSGDLENPYDFFNPEVKAAYYTINVEGYYPISVVYDKVDEVFLSEGAIFSIVDEIVSSTVKGHKKDQYDLMRYMFAKKALDAINREIAFPIPATDSEAEILITARTAALNFPILSTEYNDAEVYSDTPADRIECVIANPELARISVKELAAAFNLEYAKFMGNLTGIHAWTFTDDEKERLMTLCGWATWPISASDEAKLASVIGVICDRELVQVYNAKEPWMLDNQNGRVGYRNYFLHCKEIYDLNPFANCVVLYYDR